MQSTQKNKIGVLSALVAGFALLVAVVPSAASTPSTANIEEGTLTLTQSGEDDILFDLAEPGDDPCGHGDDAQVHLDIDKNSSPWDTLITGTNIAKAVFHDDVSGDWFQVELTRAPFGPQNGEIDGSDWTFQNFSAILDIWRLGNGEEPDCEKPAIECTAFATLDLAGDHTAGPPQEFELSSSDPNGDQLTTGSPCSSTLIDRINGESIIADGLAGEIKK